MSAALLATTLLLVSPAPIPTALAGDGVRITLSGPAVPYATVAYEVASKRGTIVATVEKQFAADFGQRSEVAILTRQDLDVLLVELAGLGLFSAQSAQVDGARAALTVEARWGDRAVRVTAPDPSDRPDSPLARIARRVRGAVTRETGRQPFGDQMLLPAERGRLRLTSRPAARVRLDGVTLDGRTPMLDVTVTAGPHTLDLSSDAGPTRTYTVQVDVGKTTAVDVDLD